ncbi:DoxX family protein [Streptosporangium saharense]|uniref:DoxX family protein n=1 Tax=Streptosporangium saharense TaxID=1706840 RepID=UPI00332FDB2C
MLVTSEKQAPPRSRTASSTLPWVTTVSRLVLAGVLIVAGWGKIGTPVLSVQSVKAYELLPDSLATVVGYGLPILEIVIGVLLVVGLLTRVVGGISALLMLAFVIGIASVWARGLRIDCGCFGGGGQLKPGIEPDYLVDILRDSGLFVLGVLVARFGPGRLALDSALGLAPEREPYDEMDGEGEPREEEDH